jgi:hypothetical protein
MSVQEFETLSKNVLGTTDVAPVKLDLSVKAPHQHEHHTNLGIQENVVDEAKA